ncbi:hypothetical protein P7K49_012140 [Saguinus oedipus]|uniref:Uncharacterized protein n=1 Tax=Saguinus oedipus TaxID=9490 RepID=A0ABQ9VSM5_SAGOE|nr:hypothetical protein P7K49_012140 [Saguinus oedipus]
MPQGPWSASGQGWGAPWADMWPPFLQGLPGAGLLVADVNSCSRDSHSNRPSENGLGHLQFPATCPDPRPPGPGIFPLSSCPRVAHSDTQSAGISPLGPESAAQPRLLSAPADPKTLPVGPFSGQLPRPREGQLSRWSGLALAKSLAAKLCLKHLQPQQHEAASARREPGKSRQVKASSPRHKEELPSTPARFNYSTERGEPGEEAASGAAKATAWAAKEQRPILSGLPTFLTEHAVAQDQLRTQRLPRQQLAQGPAGVHCQALRGQVQPAPGKLVQLLQDSLLGLGPTLPAQAAVAAPELLHDPRGRQDLLRMLPQLLKRSRLVRSSPGAGYRRLGLR